MKNRPAFLWDKQLKKLARKVGNMIRKNELNDYKDHVKMMGR